MTATVRQFTVTSNRDTSAPWLDPPPTIKVYTVSVAESHEKTSVDTGVFTPGIYRVNPYAVKRSVYDLKSGTITTSYTKDSWTYKDVDTGYLGVKGFAAFLPTCPALGSDATVRGIALQKAMSRLGQNDVGLGENLGELRETIQMLRSPFKQIRDFLWSRNFHNLGLLNKLLEFRQTGRWALRRKGGSTLILEGARAASAASSAWLEFRYGFMPLMYTLQDVVEMVMKKAEDLDTNKIRSVRASYETEDYFKGSKYWAYYVHVYYGDFVCHDKIRASASVQYRQISQFGNVDLLGLGPRFIPELAWELTRLSFVVDWWFTVGDYLGSLRVVPEIVILGNTVGVKVTRHVTVTGKVKTPTPAPVYTEQGLPDLGTYKVESYTRTCNEHLPITPLLTPDYKSYLHAIDSLALFLQKILRKVRR